MWTPSCGSRRERFASRRVGEYVIGTSVSLRRIDRACYQDRCDAHSDTSDDTYSPTRRDAKRSRREPEEGVHTASRSVDHVARSMPASAWRTPWTVAKPKTPMVAVRWRERWRSVPNRRSFTAIGPSPSSLTQKSTILKLGPHPLGASPDRCGPLQTSSCLWEYLSQSTCYDIGTGLHNASFFSRAMVQRRTAR